MIAEKWVSLETRRGYHVKTFTYGNRYISVPNSVITDDTIPSWKQTWNGAVIRLVDFHLLPIHWRGWRRGSFMIWGLKGNKDNDLYGIMNRYSVFQYIPSRFTTPYFSWEIHFGKYPCANREGISENLIQSVLPTFFPSWRQTRERFVHPVAVFHSLPLGSILSQITTPSKRQ